MAVHKAMWVDRARTLAFCVLALLVVASIGVLAAKPVHAATFTVNRTGDDPDDPDTEGNNRQNFPVITSARKFSTGVTTISGTINSNPNQSFAIQCFVADGDPSNHGEGQIFLAQDTNVTTDANGDGSFTCITTAAAVGQEVSATATNTTGTATGTAIGDTSEFSENAVITPGP